MTVLPLVEELLEPDEELPEAVVAATVGTAVADVEPEDDPPAATVGVSVTAEDEVAAAVGISVAATVGMAVGTAVAAVLPEVVLLLVEVPVLEELPVTGTLVKSTPII